MAINSVSIVFALKAKCQNYLQRKAFAFFNKYISQKGEYEETAT